MFLFFNSKIYIYISAVFKIYGLKREDKVVHVTNIYFYSTSGVNSIWILKS